MNRLAIIVVCLGCSACSMLPTSVNRIVEAQTPGVATGAGATLTGPANSATPTTQNAERTIAFTIPNIEVAAPTISIPQPAVPLMSVEPPPPRMPPMSMPQVAWIQERTSTSLGQHQDAAGIVKVAATMSGWSSVKWIGFLCILVCVGGLLWSHGNPDGYPLVFWKVGGVGLFLVLVGDHPAWLLLLLLPLGLYALQKLNLLRIP